MYTSGGLPPDCGWARMPMMVNVTPSMVMAGPAVRPWLVAYPESTTATSAPAGAAVNE
jgi:hypothetical protein